MSEELKHIRCEIINKSCGFKYSSKCKEEIKKAYDFDRRGFGEWVGAELSKRRDLKMPEAVAEQTFNEIFGKSKNFWDGYYSILQAGHNLIFTKEQTWDVMCEAAINFNKKEQSEDERFEIYAHGMELAQEDDK